METGGVQHRRASEPAHQAGLHSARRAVDLDADAACLDVLYRAGYRVLSEESGISGPPGSDSAPIVVIDPLDGSTNASRHVPWYASALCLVDDDGPAELKVAARKLWDDVLAIGEKYGDYNGGK